MASSVTRRMTRKVLASRAICYACSMATSKRKDFTQTALDVVRQATGEVTVPAPSKKQESGRIGGLKGGVARAIKLAPKDRKAIATKAAATRWGKKASSEV